MDPRSELFRMEALQVQGRPKHGKPIQTQLDNIPLISLIIMLIVLVFLKYIS